MLTPIELIKATVDGMAARGFGRVVNITSGAVKAPIDVARPVERRAQRPDRLRRRPGAQHARRARRDDQRPAARRVRHRPRCAATIGSAGEARAGVDGRVDVERSERAIPAQRFGTTEEFGAVCAFLCSVHAGYITGQNMLIDGGAYPGTF